MKKISLFIAVLFAVGPLFARSIVYKKATGDIVEAGDGDLSRYKDDPALGIIGLDEKNVPDDFDISTYRFNQASKGLAKKNQSEINADKADEEAKKDAGRLAIIQSRINAIDELLGMSIAEVLADALENIRDTLQGQLDAILEKYK